ncbi:hypothetical protein PIB30_024003 [Stylosanthes scabra]|uniref:Uncharacterized protein n=1 Tax=Stylosanthes scabra TaxID=79078 RepID=A0ABU6ZB97_9FABA|nr:hypothetical protein [Stylosanthes scabra]
MSNSNLIVDTLYLDGEMKRDADGIGFECPNSILCYIHRVDTLDELKNFILRTMGAVGRKYVRRIAYRLLNILPPLEYKFKIFWLEGDVDVRAMFELHQRFIGVKKNMRKSKKNIGSKNGLEKACESGDFTKGASMRSREKKL